MSGTASHLLRFPQLEREISTREGETLFESARRHGVRIVGACGGRGTCGSCVVRINEGRAEDLQAAEGEREIEAGSRKWHRACHLRALSDCTLEVAPRSLAPVVRAEHEHEENEFLPLDPLITHQDLWLAPATLDDPRADLDRVTDALGAETLFADPIAARELAGLLREEREEAHWPVRVWCRGDELIGFARPGTAPLGLAVDLGTTNLAAFLMDLESGERLVSLGVENPQTAWGADVISRINETIRRPDSAAALREAVAEAINALAHDLCQSIGRRRAEILEVALCGNTAMHHLLLGLPVRQLGRAPFVAALRDSLDMKTRELGIAVAPGAWIHLAPNVGGFIGGDHVTALLASEEIWSRVDAALVMDVGTNTEISVISRGRIFSASAPSGPALEGGHIGCGMRAAEGAIERVAMKEGRLAVETIGGRKPVGLCGSGVLDALAAGYQGGLISARGRIARAHPDVTEAEGGRAMQLAPEVLFTQHDVRAVQLAKAAIRTAGDLLLEEAGVSAEALDAFIIAGAFGSYIDIASGIAIGLFPDLPRERFHQVGNAAGLGIRGMLVSGKARRYARELATRCRYLELNSRSDFQQHFLRNIDFPELAPAAGAASS